MLLASVAFYFLIVSGGFSNTVGPFASFNECESVRKEVVRVHSPVVGRTLVSSSCWIGPETK